jgi:predicted P-loop ATPase
MNNEKLENLWQELKTERDELRVQMHLAKAELRDEWEELEEQYAAAQKKFDDVKKGTGEMASEAKTAMSIIVDEISTAYQRVKLRLRQQ